MNQIRKKSRVTAPAYLELPVPVRAVADGHPIVVVNAGIGGCGCEYDNEVVGLRDAHELYDFEPLTMWLANVERLARRKQRRVELTYPVGCKRQGDDLDLVTLTGVRPDGTWLGHDDDGSVVRVRLPDVVMMETTEEYLGEICEATRFLDGMVTGRAASCTRG